MSNELIQDMTRKEAEDLNTEIRSAMGNTRIGVYLMHKREGYKALGFKDFGDYCEDMIDTPRRTAYDWITQVQSTCDALGLSITNLCEIRTNEKGTLLSLAAANELKKLPSADDRRKAWTQIEALKEHGMRSPREYTLGLKKLVKQMLNRDSESPSQPSSSMPAPSAFDKAQESKTPAQTTPASTPATKTPAEKPKPQTVRGFTPDTDTDPEPELSQIDFSEAEEALNTLLTWVQNEKIDGDSEAKRFVIGSLCELSQWVEASL